MKIDYNMEHRYICISKSPFRNRVLNETEAKHISSALGFLSIKDEPLSGLSNLINNSEPEMAFVKVISSISDLYKNKGSVYAAYNYKQDSIRRNLTYREAKHLADYNEDIYVIPMEALNPL